MVPWELGFYTMLAMAITVIMGVLATRLVYVNKQYEKILEEHKNYLHSLEKEAIRDFDKLGGNIDSDLEAAFIYLVEQRHEMKRYKKHKNSNWRVGVTIDIIAVMSFFFIGLALVLDIGRDGLSILSAYSAIMFMTPLVHFGYHLNILKKASRPTSVRP